MTLPEFDPSDAHIRANPYSLLKAWREKEPVHWNPVIRRWMVLKHRDVQAILKHPAFSSESRNPKQVPFFLRVLLKPLLDGILKSMLFRDAPEHTRLRTSVSAAFLPKTVSNLRPKMEKIAQELLDRAALSGKMELVADFAFPFPVTVISELLGVDPADQARFRKWSNAITAIVVSPKVGLRELWRANQSAIEMRRYFRALFRRRLADPRDDLVSRLLALEDGRLSDDELFSMCMLILVAGHETTTNMIGLAVLALLQNPEQLALLRADPNLLDKAVDELLRYDSSVQALARVAREDTEWGGRSIQKGDMLLLSLASANRDPEYLADPDRLDITRASPQGLTFGHGPHFCLGASLTKLELKVALQALLAKFPNLALERQTEGQTLDWIPALSHRGLRTLNLRWD